MTQDYILQIISTVLLALNFAVTKAYQQKEGTSLEKGLQFNIVLGLFSAVFFWALNGFRLECSAFSVLMASAFAVLKAAYTIIGFQIMSKGKISFYTFFLMTGGMIVPYIWGLIFLNEPASLLRTTGLLVIAAALFIINADGPKPGIKQILMCCAVFVLNGFVSVISKEHQINTAAVSAMDFVVLTGIATAVLCSAALFFVKRKSGEKKDFSFKPVMLILGAALLSGFSYLLQLIGAENLPSTVLYPIITGGSIIFTAFSGILFFKEKVTSRTMLGMGLCFLGTCMFL